MRAMGAVLLASGLSVAAPSAWAQERVAVADPWSFRVLGGYAHQFETNIDGGGDLTVDRALVNVGASYAFDRRTSAGVTLAYRFDSFDFGGNAGFAALRPWSDVHELQLSAPLRRPLGERVDAFVTPQIAWSAETRAGFGDAFTGGAIGGAAYRINDDLALGAGVGIFSEIEDDASIFPILIIDWRLSPTLSLTTTPSTGLTRGPTLNANWRPIEAWTFTLGGGYENYRFRLDRDDGVGQEKAFPVYAAASFEPQPGFVGSLVAGMALGGQVRFEDRDGRLIAKEDYDPAPFLGVSLRARF
ncbi:MAG: hypothetical protein EA356_08495 [Geminicoccaceae bacterium]|nr:MAG: hypothetical protein EA356_08495 [Geminicoccaceae bacterium]